MKLITTLNDNLDKVEVWEKRLKDRLEYFEYTNHRVLHGPRLATVYLENGEYYPSEYGELQFWGGIREVKE